MDSAIKKTLGGLAIISAILLVAGTILFKTLPSSNQISSFPYLIVFFLIINSVFFLFFFRSVNKADHLFIRNFLIITLIKTLLYVAAIFVFVLTSPGRAIPIAIALVALYFSYTAYDLFIILRLLKRKKEKKPSPGHFSN